MLATGVYTARFARNTPVGRVDLADTIKLSLSWLLAVTPQDSLALSVDVEHGDDLRVNGAAVVGTDRTSAVAQLGMTMVLSRSTVMTVAAGMGITADAPDLQLSVTVPVRF
jgi:hypothetical protein